MDNAKVDNKAVNNAPDNKALVKEIDSLKKENKQLKVDLGKSNLDIDELEVKNEALKKELGVKKDELVKESGLKVKAETDLSVEKESHKKSIIDKDDEIKLKVEEKDEEIKVKIEEKDLELNGVKSLLPPVPKVYEVIEEYQGIKVGVEYLESSFKPSIINHMLKKGYWKEKECK